MFFPDYITPIFLLSVGLAIVGWAVWEIKRGETSFRQWTFSRKKDPGIFWMSITFSFLFALVWIAIGMWLLLTGGVKRPY
jgi:hypothetical protein